MNLEFNIAVHVLCFLAKHKDKHYSSTELAELTCLNPVQLRRVMSQLNNSNYIQTIRGKHGGYQANLFSIKHTHNAYSQAVSIVIVSFQIKLPLPCHTIANKNSN